MIFSIIINTHNQYKTIIRCIRSCLNQNFKKKYEIIIVDTSQKKIKNRILKSKKIKYFHITNFSKHAEVNQLKKVHFGQKKSKGKWFCLMDGDDFFEKNKLKYIYENYNLNNQIIIQDKCYNFDEYNKIKKIPKNKNFKKYYFYKKVINFWPLIYGTSSLSGNLKTLKSFFKYIDINKWTVLAIDALLILYALNKNKYILDQTILTNKSIAKDSLGDKYKILNKKYWERRAQQINYWETLSKNKIFNLDKILCKFINIFVV